MARRQRRFCTSGSPLASCPASSCQASTSGRDASSLSFNIVGYEEAVRCGRPLAFASTALKAQASVEVAPSKAPPSGGDKPLHDVLAGALARAISQGTIHPIDTLKVRMQAANRAAASGTSAAAGSTVSMPHGRQPPLQPLTRVGGAVRDALKDAKSLYRGVLGAASGAGIIIGAFFAFYSTSKSLLRQKTDLSEGTVAFIAGAIAAVGSSVVKVPIAVCIRSVQAGVYPNALVAASSVVQKAGVRGLFTGFLPTLLEDVPDMAVKFAVYETLRAVHLRLHDQERPSTLEDLVMGGVAGSAAAAATTPLDVVKTRMMCSASERPTVMQAARGILAERPGGVASFFRGVGPRAISNGLNSAIFYMWFELLRAHIRELMNRRQQQRQQQQQPATGQAIPALLVGQSAFPQHQEQRRYEQQQQQQQRLQQQQQAHRPAPPQQEQQPQTPYGDAKGRSGSGHQAVASCSLRWRGGGLCRIGEGDVGCDEALTSSGRQLDVGDVAAWGAAPGTGRRALHFTAPSGRSSLQQAAVWGPSGRIACLSLAVPLL